MKLQNLIPIFLIFIILNTTTAHAATEYIEVAKKASCTEAQFKNYLISKNFKIVSLSRYKVSNKLNAKIDFPANQPNLALRWSAKTTKYLALKNPTPLQTKTYFTLLRAYKSYILTKVPCVIYSGINLPYKLLGNSYSTGDLSIATDFETLLNRYPLKPNTLPPLVISPDSIISNHVLDEHLKRMEITKSFVPGRSIFEPYTSPSHSAIMSLLGMSVSYINTVNLGIADFNKIHPLSVPLALNYAATLDSTREYVVSLAFASELGNKLDTTESLIRLYNKNIPIVQGIGNRHVLTDPLKTYDPYVFSLGFTVNKEIKSDYGIAGPDFVLELTKGKATPIYYSSTQNSVVYGELSEIKSSGATAIFSSQLAVMRNHCPKATPKQLKDILCKTATKADISFPNNKYIRCGIPDFTKALDLIMETVCPEPIPVTPPEVFRELLSYASTLPSPINGTYSSEISLENMSRVEVFLQMCKDYPEYKATHIITDNPRAIPTHVEGWRCRKTDANGVFLEDKYLNMAFIRPNPKLIFKKYIYISQ